MRDALIILAVIFAAAGVLAGCIFAYAYYFAPFEIEPPIDQ